MKTEQVKLSQVKVNAENPRTISSDKFNKLVNSILVLPKMLEVRPVVVDGKMVAIGGNMRTNALREIAKMNIGAITDRLMTMADFIEKTEGERKTLVEFWHNWLDKPVIPVVNASGMSEAERKQFIIKDNTSSGQWNYDALANKWDNGKLSDWGMDVWNTNPVAFTPMGATAPSVAAPAPAEPDASEEDDPTAMFQEGLPAELQGVDIVPDTLPKIEGNDETAMERVIIVYPKDQLQHLLNLLGMPALDKVVYRLDEILPELAE